MQYTLTTEDVTKAVVLYLNNQGISATNMNTNITTTVRRKPNKGITITAHVDTETTNTESITSKEESFGSVSKIFGKSTDEQNS